MIPADVDESEYAPYYARYISLVDPLDIMEALDAGYNKMIKIMNSIPPYKYDYSYAEGKWSIKESLIHLIDTERIFAYRALRIARGDKTPLAGFEQDDYVPQAKANQRSFTAITKEYKAVRNATKSLFKSFDEQMNNAIGVASNSDVSVRALGYMIAGHEIHHINILNERYLDDK